MSDDSAKRVQGMHTSVTPTIERIARVLAGLEISKNGDGVLSSAGADVDHEWHDFVEHATAVLNALREPDKAMAAVGDPEVWSRMILTALGKAVQSDVQDTGYTAPEPGTDPMHEGP